MSAESARLLLETKQSRPPREPALGSMSSGSVALSESHRSISSEAQQPEF
jgi:hypothetical protein